MIIILIDITIQIIYRLFFLYRGWKTIRFKIFRALGFIKAANIRDNEINNIKQSEIFGKSLLYFFMNML